MENLRVSKSDTFFSSKVATIASHWVCIFLNLTTGIISARTLSIEERGTGAIYVTYTIVVIYFLDLGLTNSILISQSKLLMPPHARRFRLYLFIIIGTSTGLVAIGFHLNAHTILTPVVVASVLFCHGAIVIGRIFNSIESAKTNYSQANISRIVQALVFCILVCTILPRDRTGLNLFFIFTVSWIASTAYILICSTTFIVGSASLARPFYKLMFSSFVTSFSAIDGVKLDAIYSSKDPSISAGVAIINAIVSVSRSLPTALMPTLVREMNTNVENGKSRDLDFAQVIFSLGSTLLAIPFAIFLTPILFGNKYSNLSWPILVYIVAGSLGVVRIILSELLRAKGKLKFIVVSESIGFASGLIYMSQNPVASVKNAALLALICQTSIVAILTSSFLGRLVK